MTVERMQLFARICVHLRKFSISFASAAITMKGVNVKAWILIVSDDPVLLHTRAELLRDWQITTALSRHAEEAMRARNYDLLILSQTVQETRAKSLIAQARELQPNSRILAIRSEEDRQFGSTTYQVGIKHPGGF